MTTVAALEYRQSFPDGELRRNFHTGQARAWDSKRRFVIMSGSPQVGKTCFGPDWLEREINDCGPGDYLAITWR